MINEIKKRYSGRSNKPSRHNDTTSWYKNFYAKLKPYQVVIPFADDLPISGLDPSSRRMSKILLDLLCTVALINQHTREIWDNQLIADPQDFEILQSFLKEPTDRRQTKLTARENAVLAIVRTLPNQADFGYEDLMRARPGCGTEVKSSYSLTSVKYAISRLVAAGIVHELERRGRIARFSLKDREVTSQRDA